MILHRRDTHVSGVPVALCSRLVDRCLVACLLGLPKQRPPKGQALQSRLSAESAQSLSRVSRHQLPLSSFRHLRSNLHVGGLFKNHPPISHSARHVVASFNPNTAEGGRGSIPTRSPVGIFVEPTSEPNPAATVGLCRRLLGCHKGSRCEPTVEAI